MKNLKYLFILAAAIALSSCGAPQQSAGGSYTGGPQIRGNIKFLVPWGNGKITVQSVVEEIDSAGYKLRNLVFFKDSLKDNDIIFSKTSRDYAVALFPLKDNAGNLMIIWQSGVAYRFSVYSFQNEKIVNVLESGSADYPELFYEKKDSEDLSILVTNMDLVNNKKTKEKNIMPVSATLYRWKSDRYISIPNIPWAKRFSQVK